MKSLEECRHCSHHVDEIALQIVCDYWGELECRVIRREPEDTEDFIVDCPWEDIITREKTRITSKNA